MIEWFLLRDPSLMHGVLLFAGIVASFSVAVGIVLESPKWSLANVLVIGGVAIEAVCTLLLFGFDEGISAAQQSKIIALEERLASRSLTSEQSTILARKLQQFDGQLFEIIPYWDNPESVHIGDNIADALISAHWKLDQPKVWTALAGVITGVIIDTVEGAPPKTTEAATALVAGLRAANIEATAHTAKGSLTDNATHDKISLRVGIKP